MPPDLAQQSEVDSPLLRAAPHIIASLLFILTTVVFWPCCANSFVGWDDLEYVYGEPKVLDGLTLSGVAWALTANVSGNWHPVTMLSLQIDAQLFGPGPYGFHRTAVLLHALNAAMLFWMLFYLTGEIWPGAIVAMIFAVHPLRVESVAWVSERKDLLCGFFFSATVIAYRIYVNRPTTARKLLVMICMILGLMSKSMLVTIPCVLLLLDYWPLRRFEGSSESAAHRLGQLVVEKLPLFAIAGIFCAITLWTQNSGISSWSLQERVATAMNGYVIYLRQTFWPCALMTFYERREISLSGVAFSLGWLICITAIAMWQRVNRPYVLVGWLWYVGMLFPVIGVVQVGRQTHADRYTYLPQIGILISLVWLSFDLAKRARGAAVVVSALLVASILGCVPLTREQILVWRDTETLWRHNVQLDPEQKFSVRGLLLEYFTQGKTEQAIGLADQMIRSLTSLDESDITPTIDAATFLLNCGKLRESSEIYDKLANAFPDHLQIVLNRAEVKAMQGDWHAVVLYYQKAIEISPQNEAIPFYLAHAMQKTGDENLASEIAMKALARAPKWPGMAARLAYQNSKVGTARSSFSSVCLAEQASFAKGDRDPRILDVLAVVLANAGRFEEAVVVERKALALIEHSHDGRLINDIKTRIRLFEIGQPFRGKHEEIKADETNRVRTD